MTMEQWEAHTGHMANDITWPATKEQVVAACGGSDVDPAVLEDLKNNLPDGTYNSADDVKTILVH